MSNIFAMVTLENSNFYTDYAIKSFFQNTEIDKDDEFLLINNDKCDVNKFSSYNKVKILENEKPASFAQNVNKIINLAIKKGKDIVFLNNDIIFTKNWFHPLKQNTENISIPVNNQLFPYHSDCGKLKLKVTMNLKDFNEEYDLLNNIVLKHVKKYKSGQEFQTLLMPFFCFKVPNKILKEIGNFDESFVMGAEDIDYRIRCAKKGYEVNFVIDSYLLHFHGKSTWDGKESFEETNQRNKSYTGIFLKKWGKELTQLFIIRKDFLNILNEKKLNELYEKGKFGDLIRKIL